jgi:hypothetical protein
MSWRAMLAVTALTLGLHCAAVRLEGAVASPRSAAVAPRCLHRAPDHAPPRAALEVRAGRLGR